MSKVSVSQPGSWRNPFRIPPPRGLHLWTGSAQWPCEPLYVAEVAAGVWVRTDRPISRQEQAQLARAYRRGEPMATRPTEAVLSPELRLTRAL